MQSSTATHGATAESQPTMQTLQPFFNTIRGDSEMSDRFKVTQYRLQDSTVKSATEYYVTAKRRSCPLHIRSICILVVAALLLIKGPISVAQPTNASPCQTCLIRIDRAIEALGAQTLNGEQNLLVKETIDGKAVIEKRIRTIGSVDTLTSQSIISGESDVPRGRKLTPANQMTRKPVRQETLWIYHPLRQLLALRSVLPQDAEMLSLENPITGKQEDALLIPESHGESLRIDRQAWFFDTNSNLPKVAVIYRSRGDSPSVTDMTIAFQRFSLLNGVVVPVSILQKTWNGHETMIEISSPNGSAQ